VSAVRLVLASASPARLGTLRAAGLDPEVVVSGVDESGVVAESPAALTAELARLKAEAVDAALDLDLDHRSRTTIVIGCDSMLELDGRAYGKPGTAAAAVERWRSMRGRSGVLNTGHHVVVHQAGSRDVRAAVGSTRVTFAALTDEEIDAYVATGEPLEVAGAFTVDGLGGPFVERIEGDYHNVVGISLPLVRVLLTDLGVAWPSLWARTD
jgi:septum formation protein